LSFQSLFYDKDIACGIGTTYLTAKMILPTKRNVYSVMDSVNETPCFCSNSVADPPPASVNATVTRSPKPFQYLIISIFLSLTARLFCG